MKNKKTQVTKDLAQNGNFIRLNRSFFDHYLWCEKRSYTRAEAWLDIIQQARFAITPAKQFIAGKIITWNRGQLPVSIRFLATRWCWGKKRVECFLKLLKKESMITSNTTQGQTIISVTNFEKYNKLGQSRGRTNPYQNRVSDKTGEVVDYTKETVRRRRGDKTKKVNKDKNVFFTDTKDFKSLTEGDLRREVLEFSGKYAADHLSKFLNYWTEKDTSGKMRFQLGKTWETAKRLNLWNNTNQINIKNENNTKKLQAFKATSGIQK